MRINPPFFWCSLFLIGLVFFLSSDAFAAAAMQRRVQQQKMQQQQMMQQAYQQAVAQKQAQEVAAYQQAVAQRQAMMQQAAYQKAAAEYSAYKQAMQQAVAKRTAELQAVEQMKQMVVERQQQQVAEYQTAVARKQVAEVAAYKQGVAMKQAVEQKAQAEVNQQIQEYAQYLAARKSALAQQGIMAQQAVVGQQLLQQTAVQHVKNQQARAAVEGKIVAQAVGVKSVMGQKMAADVLASRARDEAQSGSSMDQPDTVVDIQDLWKALDVSSEAWAQIVDREIKVLTVSEYIDRFRKMKIKISRPPGYYVGLIDALGEQMTGFLSAPFTNVLSYAAIVEYDFDNGTNKDELARQILGSGQFESNRKRVLGL
jgi:hypothetical protein